jgi:hypothetical protein
MLRANIRLIFGGLGAVAIGLSGGWGLLVLTFPLTSASNKQAAIVRAAVPDVRERTPPLATAPPDPAPETVARTEPVSPAPARIAERTPPQPAAPSPNADAAPAPVRSPGVGPSAAKPTKVAEGIDEKRRVRPRRVDDDDDDD